jgi:transposase
MRYGMLSNTRRSWSKVGERALLDTSHGFENHYLYSAVAPLSGDSFHLMGIAGMDSEATHLFLTHLKKQHPRTLVIVVWDGAPCHRSQWVTDIKGLTTVFLPPYSPELNPAERFFEEMRRATANRVFESLETQEELIADAINSWMDDKAAMRQLLGYEWILQQAGVVN